MFIIDIDIIKTKTTPILRHYGVVRAFLFGSFARGEQSTKSDIDILVEYKPGTEVSLFEAIDLKYELEEALNRKVDVLTEAAIPPYIRPHVLKDKKVIM